MNYDSDVSLMNYDFYDVNLAVFTCPFIIAVLLSFVAHELKRLGIPDLDTENFICVWRDKTSKNL